MAKLIKSKVVDIDSVQPNKYNPNSMPEHLYEFLKRSMEDIGFIQPIIITKDNIIIDGEHRWKALKELGETKIEVKVLDLTEDEAKRGTINLNLVKGTMDYKLMGKILLEQEKKYGSEVLQNAIALNKQKINQLIDKFQVSQEPSLEQLEEENEDILVKYGDIVTLGRHVIMCGDSTNKKDMDKLISKYNIDVLLTDPPYGINVVNNGTIGGGGELKFGTIGGGHFVPSKVYPHIIGDDSVETAKLVLSLTEYIPKRIIFGGNYFTDILPPSRCWVVWDKENTGQFGDCELAWTNLDKPIKLYHYLWNGLARAGDRKSELTKRVHPTQKPVGLLNLILTDFTDRRSTIYDPFLGSGSTLIACEQTDRTCIGIEISPDYCQLVIDRWETYTGDKAIYG